MAEVLKDFEFDTRRGGREQYDWKNWFDGQTWALAPDVDFKGTPEDFRTTVYSAAERYKVKTRTTVVELEVEVTDSETGETRTEKRPHLVIKAIPVEGEAKAGADPADADDKSLPAAEVGAKADATVAKGKGGKTKEKGTAKEKETAPAAPKEEVRLLRP